MNLTVAAVIDGLASARKDEGALISSDNINTFIHLWSDYDPKATGWISIDAYIFLLFELPKPIGLGREVPLSYRKNYVTLYNSQMEQNSIEVRIEVGKDVRHEEYLQECKEILLIKNKERNKRYFYHTEKKILLREDLWLKILKHYNIPIYENRRIHFKDVCNLSIEEKDESIVISEEDSSSKIIPKNINHFDEDVKSNELKAVDPSNKKNVESEEEFTAEDQDMRITRMKLPGEGRKSAQFHIGHAENKGLNFMKLGENVLGIKSEKEVPGLSFYSPIDKKYGADKSDEIEELSIGEIKEIE